MPPRKDQLSEADLRQKAHDHGIRFRGPTPPRCWPGEHKHHFQVIRSIQFTRYEHYRDDKAIPISRREHFRGRVNYLRQKVRDLLDDVRPNEATWRELEVPVLERFEKAVVCGNCNNELWKSDHEANCLHEENQAKLDAKRKLRKGCTCKNKRVYKNRKSDDENGLLFSSAMDTSLTHAFGDNLQNFKIPMKPDRVIGLRAPPNMVRSDSHFPVDGRGILLPFLIMEAKKEGAVPGFRAIQYQTGFPVRRLLKAQADVDCRDPTYEPCLVWFFAYQGELWRLHACTWKDDEVRVYDLWQGTIQSQDGALQLLLIVDFIWSWARDVYRPAVKDLIRNSNMGFRDLSPVSSDRFRHSVSLCPTTSSAPTTQDFDQMQLDETIDATEDSTEPVQVPAFTNASSHSFLRWAVGQECSPLWTKSGSIRHANIVHFEFRCYRVWADEVPSEDEPMNEDDVLLYNALSSCAFAMTPKQLHEIAVLWTTDPVAIPSLDLTNPIHVTFFFQTYCNRSTWQIMRVLNCLIWETGRATSDLSASNDLERAVLQVRSIHGKDSVGCALRTVDLILIPKDDEQNLGWTLFAQANLPGTASGTLRDLTARVRLGNVNIHRLALSGDLLWVDTSIESHIPEAWRHITRDGNSMLAIRYSSWPSVCPKYCLFVLLDRDFATLNDLHQLLEEAISLRNYYGEDGYRWSQPDRRILRKWRKSLQSEE